MHILSIETSCDETSAAVLKELPRGFSLLSNIISSQVKLHAAWGGVVPNLAAREHLKNITPVIGEALQKAGIEPKDIGLIAVTNGPGLIPALLIGVEAAKTLGYLWKVPLIGVHHIEGHIYANFLEFPIDDLRFEKEKEKSLENQKSKIGNLKFPILCLVVSGGHTQLVLMKDHLQYQIVGETQDDAAGEAFDKVARILNLGYPGGPVISEAADKLKLLDSKNKTDPKSKIENLISEISLPRPMINSHDFNFSFSGLKTAVLYLVKKNEAHLKDENFVAAVAKEFQQSVIDVLIAKTLKAAKKYEARTIMLAGGVSANRELRQQLGEAVESSLPNTKYHIPDTIFTGDNAAMIGAAAYFRWKNSKKEKLWKENWKKLEARADFKLND